MKVTREKVGSPEVETLPASDRQAPIGSVKTLAMWVVSDVRGTVIAPAYMTMAEARSASIKVALTTSGTV